MAKVLAVCISESRGVQKHPVQAAELRADFGIVGDAHAGPWHRQVSILSRGSVQKLQDRITMELKPGDFAENILVEGMEVFQLPVGTKLLLGSALVEVTQIGKTCHADCAIRRQAGDCVMPREGIFVRVLQDGVVRPGDELSLTDNT